MIILAADIETADADQLHSYGPGFIRLCGWQELDQDGHPYRNEVSIATDPAEFASVLLKADAVTMHNGINFDHLALAVQGYITRDEYESLCMKTFDTLITTRHLDPVAAKGAQSTGYYRLGETAERYGLDGKDTVDWVGRLDIVRRIKGDDFADRILKARYRLARKDGSAVELDLKTEAREVVLEAVKSFRTGEEYSVLQVLKDCYGGYDQISQDDPDYRRYLIKDVTAQGRLFAAQSEQMHFQSAASQRYVRREHYTQLAMGRVTLEGFRTDVDLTMKRWAEGQARLEAQKKMMHERHGMPLEGKKPHTTNPGKAAFRAAIIATGISEQALVRNWPLNKDNSLSTSKPVLTGLIEIFDRTRPEAAELCRTVLAMNGERTVYGTVLSHLVDGRVHPYIGPDQASGRWSMKNPGLTVLGKRGGKAVERAMMLPDEGDVLVAIDADQIDARMIAALSQDPEYMKLFGPGVDLHSEVALRVFNRPECREEMARNNGRCDCEYRDRAKVFGHGWNYGMTPNGMVKQHGVDFEVAKRFDEGMQEAFPVLCKWKADVREEAGVLGFGEEAPAGDTYRILHTAFGRPVRVERNRAYTQACAQIGQGSTRDGMAEAILKLPAPTRRRIRAVIHDEIVLSIPGGADAQQRAQAIADGMAYEINGVRISFGCSRVAKNWAGCYGEQYETAA